MRDTFLNVLKQNQFHQICLVPIDAVGDNYRKMCYQIFIGV